jgi:protein-disulfide isomerase
VDAQFKKLNSVISTLIALQVATVTSVVGMTWYSHKELKAYVASVVNAAGQRQPSTPENVEDWQDLVRQHNAAQGPATAQVVMVEFSDFQCPYCKRYNDEIRTRIAAAYGDDVRMVFKHYPLDQVHPQAMTAAIAAQCAQREGKFWEIHDRFFDQPDALDVDSVIAVGEELGLSESYANCVHNQETRPEIERDIQDAQEAGVQATPTFMINGRFLVGVQSEAAFRSAFEEAGLKAD